MKINYLKENKRFNLTFCFFLQNAKKKILKKISELKTFYKI